MTRCLRTVPVFPILVVTCLSLSACSSADSSKSPAVRATASGLKFVDEQVGTGPEVKIGDTVRVEYTGWLKNGRKFDTSVGGKPLEFQIGAVDVMKGFSQGVAGMKVGGKRKLTIPPDLAYGPRGYPPAIPPNAELTFEIELLKVLK